ncbi:conserved membrane protein of unknown function (plasmid) [Rhodovastum atsumiense]|uniref:Uncharacterized protein n=1 Tax=Rhodovastum atsumiense TaxID=504468 RepID=A0A5M6IMV3_9PROT|nr:hypothetical protein [Rhodovastum atsumiense]KAA5609581.1 hypothetical protein F1189_23440 [Rhodovastum atsumiense]CAH2606414.1 conserved membrane protein of unknown function [Rhodovastum atsumiense]
MQSNSQTPSKFLPRLAIAGLLLIAALVVLCIWSAAEWPRKALATAVLLFCLPLGLFLGEIKDGDFTKFQLSPLLKALLALAFAAGFATFIGAMIVHIWVHAEFWAQLSSSGLVLWLSALAGILLSDFEA